MFEKFYTATPNLLQPEQVAQLIEDISQHPLLSENLLDQVFEGSKGFSLVWKKGLRSDHELSTNYGWLDSFLKAIIEPDTNAWYLNPLVINQSGDIGAHKDQSLQPYCGQQIYPRWVSVLCLEIGPDSSGGVLELYWEGAKIAVIDSKPNQLVRFVGDLDHLVTPYSGTSPRITVVCEQYKLNPEQLEKVPEWSELSRAIQPESPRKAQLSTESPST